jgi:hypothetical protein
MCYIHAFKNGEYNVKFKKENCTLMLAGLINSLTLLCELLEINKQGLDYLKSAVIS